MPEPVVRDAEYIVVGAGVYGTSLAFHLVQKYPSASVILIDRTPFPSKVGASWDVNKVIRAEYTNLMYMELALEAMTKWRSDPLYNPFYHESGIVWVGDKDFQRAIIENYKKLDATERVRLIKIEEAKRLWEGIHAHANYEDVTDLLVSETSGWAEASAAFEKTIEHAIAAGVKYIAADVEAVIFDDHGSCTGILTTKGDVLSASHIILATGAYTAKLIADSAPQRKEMQIDGRLIAAAVSTGTVVLSDEDAEYFRKGPIFSHEVGNTRGLCLPPTFANELKFSRDVSFVNTIHHEASGQHISVPPNRDDYAQWDVSPGMKKEIDIVIKGIYGKKSNDWAVDSYRICWDAITPTQDPIICEHPHSKNLYIATGGSFHSWKFLPIIGKYILQMIEGTLDPKLARTWAWDRDGGGSAHPRLLPQREMKDV